MAKPVTKLENWATITSPDPWLAPELQRLYLVGTVYNHSDPERHPDGKEIRTSYIVEAQGRVVKTASGSVYKLGRIDPDFREFLRTERPGWDWRNPITVIETVIEEEK